MTPLRTLALLAALTACSSGSAAPASLPSVTGATVQSVGPARSLCSGEPPTTTAPTARHRIVAPDAVSGLRLAPETDASRAALHEYEYGLVGSGQSLKLLADYTSASVHAKVAILSTSAGTYGRARLIFICGSASGYLAAKVTALTLPGFADDLQCFEIPKGTKPVLCAWYDDVAANLTITGAKGTKALDLAVALRAALEKPLTH